MIFDDEKFNFDELGDDFVLRLETMSNVISMNVEKNGQEQYPLEDYLDTLASMYFLNVDQYFELLLLFLFSQDELAYQRGELKVYPFLQKTEKDLIFPSNKKVVLPKSVQSFFSRFWNIYGFTYEKIFLTEDLLQQKMYFEALNSKLEKLEMGTKTPVSDEKLNFLLGKYNSGLLFLHNSLFFRGKFYTSFYKVSSLADFKCNFFRLLLSLDYGICLVTIELIKLKFEYNRILKLTSK